MIFEWQGRLYRVFDSLVYEPAGENAARLTCWASEIGGELEEIEIDGDAAECVACQLGFTERGRGRRRASAVGGDVKGHYEERLRLARKSDDMDGYVVEITRCFIRDLKGGIVPAREIPTIARMLDEASCEASMAVTS